MLKQAIVIYTRIITKSVDLKQNVLKKTMNSRSHMKTYLVSWSNTNISPAWNISSFWGFTNISPIRLYVTEDFRYERDYISLGEDP